MSDRASLSLHARFMRRIWNQSTGVGDRTRGWWIRVSRTGLVIGGRNLRVSKGVEFRLYGHLVLADGVQIHRGSLIEVGPDAAMRLGSNVWIGAGCVLAAAEQVTVGDRVLIGEHCSVRDGEHHVDALERRGEGRLVTTPVAIGNDVWIGAGARVLKGASIGDRVVVGANSVVRSSVANDLVVGGVPARPLRTGDGAAQD